MDAIGAGQIDDVVFRGTVGEIPCFFLYRDAWIIACFLTQAGQLIEQSRLTHVGVPHQRDFSFRHNDDKGSMRMRSVSVRRKATLLGLRSEEHTSELQSLMRISYAVFCLNNKKYD